MLKNTYISEKKFLLSQNVVISVFVIVGLKQNGKRKRYLLLFLLKGPPLGATKKKFLKARGRSSHLYPPRDIIGVYFGFFFSLNFFEMK